MKVAAVRAADIEGFMRGVAEGRTAGRVKTGKNRGLSNVRGGIGTASRTVGLLGAMFTYAVRHQMRPIIRCTVSCGQPMDGASGD